jgi:hypothetical protein
MHRKATREDKISLRSVWFGLVKDRFSHKCGAYIPQDIHCLSNLPVSVRRKAFVLRDLDDRDRCEFVSKHEFKGNKHSVVELVVKSQKTRTIAKQVEHTPVPGIPGRPSLPRDSIVPSVRDLSPPALSASTVRAESTESPRDLNLTSYIYPFTLDSTLPKLLKTWYRRFKSIVVHQQRILLVVGY